VQLLYDAHVVFDVGDAALLDLPAAAVALSTNIKHVKLTVINVSL